MTNNEIREKIRELQNKIDRINSTTELKKSAGAIIAKWEEEKRGYEAALEVGGCVDEFKKLNEDARTYLESLDKQMDALDKKVADGKKKFNRNIIAACNTPKK